MFHTAILWRTALVGGLFVAKNAVEAQHFPSFDAIEVRPAIFWPENADVGFGVTGDVDLGFARYSNVRVIFGTHKYSADIDQSATGDEGSYSAFGGRVGMRLETFRLGTVRPHLTGALSATMVDADIVDPRSNELLEGFYVGADLGAGAAWPISWDGRFSAVGEFRRTFSSNVDRYALEIGVRYAFQRP